MTSVSGIHCSGRGVVVGAPRLPEGEADREPADPDLRRSGEPLMLG